MRICKYELDIITDHQTIYMPEGAILLSVQMQHSRLNVWAAVDPGAKPIKRTFWIYGTGAEIGTATSTIQDTYLGTVQMADGELVWHVFAQGPKA